MIVLYTIDCPKCRILEQKLDSKNIQYETVKDLNVMQELGIMSAPVLSVDGELLMFADAIKYVNGR